MNIQPIDKDTDFLKKTISDLTEGIALLSMLQDSSKQMISQFDFKQIIDLFLDTVNEIIG